MSLRATEKDSPILRELQAMHRRAQRAEGLVLKLAQFAEAEMPRHRSPNGELLAVERELHWFLSGHGDPGCRRTYYPIAGQKARFARVVKKGMSIGYWVLIGDAPANNTVFGSHLWEHEAQAQADRINGAIRAEFAKERGA